MLTGTRHGATAEDFGEIARINHAHSVNNPYSQFHDVYTLEQIMASPKIHDPLTKLRMAPLPPFLRIQQLTPAL